MEKFNTVYNKIVKENEDSSVVQITLALNADIVRRIEKGAEQDIKSLLETEINQNPDSFIEMMGYENW